MFNRTRFIAIVVVSIVLLSALLYIMFSEGVFIDKGSPLTILGKKTYIDPGYLLYSKGSNEGAWVVYRKTGQTIITLIDKYGVRRWQKVYSASRLLVNSSKYYTIVGETQERDLTVLNTEGERIRTWHVSGVPLLCSVDDDGRSAVVIERNNSSSEYSWLSNFTVSSMDGQVMFSKEFSNTEVIDVIWLDDAIAVLIYRVEDGAAGQYLTIYNNQGEKVYQTEIDQAVGDISASPLGEQVLWSTSNTVYRYDLINKSVLEIPAKDIIGAGFLSDSRLFMLSNRPGILPPGRRVHLVETDINGKKFNRRVYPGTLTSYKILVGGNLVITTDIGVYAATSLNGEWHIEDKDSILASAIDSEGIVYIFTADNAVSWYER